jgi:hypothetical protein
MFVLHYALDVLLTYGTNITHVSAATLEPSTSMAHRQCKWSDVTLRSEDHPSVLHLAYLPLHTVTQLLFHTSDALGLASLSLPLSTVHTSDIPALMHKAATNLVACPAWQGDPADTIYLWGDSRSDIRQWQLSFGEAERVQLFEALAPLAGPTTTQLCICIDQILPFKLGQAEVAALGRALGGTLSSLELSHCTLAPGFWAGLSTALPHLDILELGAGNQCDSADVIAYCSSRTAEHPLTLVLPSCMDDLRAALMGHKLPHVTVTHSRPE